MKKYIFTLITLMVTFIHAMAQTGVINGKVATTNGDAIEGATIGILNTDRVSVTDKQGNFSFKEVNAGSYQLFISNIGFATQLKDVQVVANQSTEVSIAMTEKSKQLEEVVVSAEKKDGNIQKIPAAISAINAQQLSEYRIWDVRDLEAVVPDLFVLI